MADQHHLDLLKQGVQDWNQWRQDHLDVYPELSAADLSNMKLNNANLSKANLKGVNLKGAEIYDARFSEADLSEADLSESFVVRTFFKRTNLTRANLAGSQLTECDLTEAELGEANLSKAELRGAQCFGASFIRANLIEADLNWLHCPLAWFIEADLTGASVGVANLHRAIFSKATLHKASFDGSVLSWANLAGADLTEANLTGANLTEADLTGANLAGANLCRATLVHTNLKKARLTNCSVYGISAWDIQVDEADQSNLSITDPNSSEPIVRVDDLEVAQLIYLLLNHKKLRNVLNAVTERGVLLLGRFGGGGLEVLQAIAAKLREEKYLPIIFDFERPRDRDYTETVKTLAGLSHFIIADLSGPSVPKELEAIVPAYKIPFAFICQDNAKPFAMSIDLFGYPWVLRPAVLFSTVEDLLTKLPTRVIESAEEMAEKIRRAKEKTLDELFSSE